jgi:hypothetical protein
MGAVGGLTPSEENFGFLQVRIKRHRWHKKILKNGDPVILSLGWRRFQTVPLFSLKTVVAGEERNRMIKYTPEHMHCFAQFWGPVTAPNTGFVAFQTLSNAVASFRVAATGVVTDLDAGKHRVVKKLKLTGEPQKVFKNTAVRPDTPCFGVECVRACAVALSCVVLWICLYSFHLNACIHTSSIFFLVAYAHVYALCACECVPRALSRHASRRAPQQLLTRTLICAVKCICLCACMCSCEYAA